MEGEWLEQGQVETWKGLFAFGDSMVLKCAVELGIADIINRNGSSMTLQDIAAQLSAPSADLHSLSRIMRFLVRKHVFTQEPTGGENGSSIEPRFGLTPASRWLVKDNDLSLAPMVLMENHPSALAPWHCFSKCVQDGGVAFEKAHGVNVWGYVARNPEFNQLFNSAMACTAKLEMKAVVAKYQHGFSQLGSLVDVGGGTGVAIAEIVKAYPHIKGINMDLPHVVATAPQYVGVTHVVGDMFVHIPKADAVLMKWVLHDWNDEDCVRILKQTRKSIPEVTGRVMIVDVVLRADEEGGWGDIRMVFDLVMMAHSSGGRERTEMEWRKLLKDGGFNRCNIISLPSLPSLIEAFPN